MSERQLSLPEDVYQGLLAAAAMEGATPAGWIATHLPASAKQQEFSPELVADLIGSIDSRQQSCHSYEKTPFGEFVIAKMAKQGVHIQ